MGQPSKREHISYMAPMFIMSNILAISPKYNMQTHVFNNSKGYRFYTKIFIVLETIAFTIGLYLKVAYVFAQFKTTLLVVDILTSITFFLVNIVSILCYNHIYISNLNAFMKTMSCVDNKLIALDVKPLRPPVRYYVEMLMVHILTISLIAFDCFVWGKLGTQAFVNSMVEGFMKYHLNGAVHFMTSFAECITIRFACLNKLLDKTPRKQDIIFILTKITPFVAVKKHVSIRDVIKIYSLICDMVDYFNKVFGWVLLLLNVTVICNFLLGLGFIIEHKSVKLDNEDAIGFVILMVIWAGGTLSLGVQLASICDKAAAEGQKLSGLTYKMLQNVAQNVATPEQRQIKADLTALSEHTALRIPQFTAAGFFVVDYSMLFTLLGSVTSYLIVLIQFN